MNPFHDCLAERRNVMMKVIEDDQLLVDHLLISFDMFIEILRLDVRELGLESHDAVVVGFAKAFVSQPSRTKAFVGVEGFRIKLFVVFEIALVALEGRQARLDVLGLRFVVEPSPHLSWSARGRRRPNDLRW